VVVENLKFLISLPGLILLLLTVGAVLVSATASHTRAGKIMIGLVLFLFIARNNGPVAYRITAGREIIRRVLGALRDGLR